MKLKAKENLTLIRDQMVKLIHPNSSVIEFGCGDGELLFRLSPKIKSGLGIDKSKKVIYDAIKQKNKNNFSNLDFLCEELDVDYKFSQTYDYSIASLFFHVIPISKSVHLLNRMMEMSENQLICAFSKPETLHQNLLLWIDQRLSGHYRNFKVYQKVGYFEGVLSITQCSSAIIFDTNIPFLKIYKISKAKQE